METPLPVCQGHEPYIFVCYAHQDRTVVYEQISWIKEQAINVWYDEGIALGTEWSEELGQAIDRADRLVFFVTPASVESQHCRDEVFFAKSRNIPIVAVHLEPTELSLGLELALGANQSVFAYELSASAYHAKLLEALTMGGAGADAVIQSNRQKENSTYYRWLLAFIGVTTLAALAAFIWTTQNPSLGHHGTATIAVLPFRDDSRSRTKRTWATVSPSQ